jgi:poly-gamma-glutamate synthesis protein (capsule biosynthesis protein)
MKANKKSILFSLLLAAILIAASLFSFPGLIISPTGKQNLPADKVLEKTYVKILFLGDLMFDRGIKYYADKNGGNGFIFEKIHAELLNNDLVVANLEGPITNEKSISAGTAPGVADNYFFTFDPSWAKTLFENNIKLVNLGNNHILNFGREGLASTKKYLSEAGVDYFGAPDYPKSISTEIKGVKITFINYNEFSALGDTEEKATIEEIQKAKKYSDIIIIFSHWGAEYVGPDQAMRNLARQFVDSGADLVVGSHSHIIGPTETYNEKRIYYSLGNFIFDQYFSEDTRKGLGVIVKIDTQTEQLDFEEKNFYLQSGGQTILVEKNSKK